METKNTILRNYSAYLSNMVDNFVATVNVLNDNHDENAATIKTLNVLLESVRSQTVLIQSSLDDYNN